jgi:glucose 1-dehydrogenase
LKAVAVFPGSQQVKIIEQDVPRLTQPDQVALRLLDVGICGTDKEICSFEYGTPPPGDDHLVIGHESLAEIVQVGSTRRHRATSAAGGFPRWCSASVPSDCWER